MTWNLTLVGPARTLVYEPPSPHYPADYIELMRIWGPGTLCGVCELPDPTEREGRFDFLQTQFRARVDRERARGKWAQLADDEIAACPVLGLHARGDAVLGLTTSTFVILTTRGEVSRRTGMPELIAALRRPPDDDEPLQPMTYNTEPPARDALYAAIVAGDEARADAAFAKVLATDGPVEGLLAIAHHLATELRGNLRATFVEQCLRAAKRHSARVAAVDIRKLAKALATDADATELVKPLAALVERSGMFFDAPVDPTERALRERLHADPDDAATRLVLADHLEARGDLATAEIARQDSLPDARERGFVPPFGVAPVDATALVDTWTAAWLRDAPEIPLADVIAAVAALHPQERQGYAVLLSQPASPHLGREAPRAWPYCVLALRGEYRFAALGALAGIREAAPFLMACLRWPTAHEYRFHQPNFAADLADAFLELGGKPSRADIDHFVEHLADRSVLAARLLVKSAADDRVFEAYLANFGELQPFATTAISKRRKEPRVREVLVAAFEREAANVLGDGGKALRYSRAYGVLAAYLKKLGVAGMAEAHDRYRKWCRIADAALNPRDSDM